MTKSTRNDYLQAGAVALTRAQKRILEDTAMYGHAFAGIGARSCAAAAPEIIEVALTHSKLMDVWPKKTPDLPTAGGPRNG